MKRAFVLIAIVLVTAVLIASISQARKSAREARQRRPTPVTNYHTKGLSDLPLEPPIRAQSAVFDTTVLAEYTFDTGGLPDPMGWYGVDLTAPVHMFFHVADATELDGGDYGRLVALEGSQSLWCGYDPFGGYGNNWYEIFESDVFHAETAINVSWKIRWDSEAGYDFTYVEYQDDIGDWVPLPVNGGTGSYSGIGGPLSESHQISGDIGSPGATRLRFRFSSSAGWSDEDGFYNSDGACIVDSILVTDQNGDTLCYEDFESESPGATATDDGIWQASGREGFGDYAALHDAFWVLQEDPCYTSISSIWGFFADPAVANYSCYGHPEQGAIAQDNSRGQYIHNEIRSPWIPFAGSGSDVVLEFDVYRDLELEVGIFYEWQVRSRIAGSPTTWVNDTSVYYGLAGLKDWYRASFEIGNYIVPGANSVQLAIGVYELGWIWGFTDPCHSHAPLFDNVKLIRIATTGPVWTVRDEHLFQDNFSTDGTTTGTVRMDMAMDINVAHDPLIVPGDSIKVTVYERELGLKTDTYTGCGPAVYLHVKDILPGKSGLAIQAPEERFMGPLCGTALRYPMVSTGGGWTVIRFDSVIASGYPLADQYCVDLKDDLYTPGDAVFFYFSAKDSGSTTYWSRYTGTTDSEAEVRSAPMEMTCLPANGLAGATDILYVDGFDQLGAQPYFDAAFEALGITPDRYDVRAAESGVGNRPGSRANAINQLIPHYHTIIWNTGDLPEGCIGDGTGHLGGYEKSDDAKMLFEFLNYHPENAAVYFSGDDLADEWASLTGSQAVALRAYMNYTVANPDHVSAGFLISPWVVGQPGSIFDHSGTVDWLIAFGGCPSINDFDVLQTTGASSMAAAYSNVPFPPNGDYGAVLVQETPNSYGQTARVALSGFSYHEIRDVDEYTPANVEHLLDILNWSGYVGGYTPVCRVQPTYLDFSPLGYPTFVDSVKTETFTIKNISGEVISGTVTEDCSHYSIVSGATYNLSPGQSNTVTVQYQPTTIGTTHTCTIETGLIDCPNVYCTGDADLLPEWLIEPTSIDFGTVSTESFLDTTFKILNLGGWSISGDVFEVCDQYSIQNGGGPYILYARESLTVDVRFSPTSAGYHTCLVDLGPDHNRMVYVADRTSGVHVVDAKDPTDPTSVREHGTSDAYGVFVSGNYAYVADGYPGGLQILNIVDPANPVSLGSYTTPHSAQDVHVSGDYAYVTAYNAGLRVIDVSDPSNPSEVGSYVIPGSGYAYGLDVSGNYAYVAASEFGLVIIDISDPDSLKEVGTYDTPTWAWDVVVSGDYAYVADGWGLIVLDISGSGNPSYVGGYQIGPWSYGVALSGENAYLANSTEGLRVIDVSDPTNPVLLGTCDTPGSAGGVAVSGHIAFVADGDEGLQVIDVFDPSDPIIVKTLDTPGLANRVAVREGGDVVLRGIGEDPGTGIQEPEIPKVFALYQNMPNPFNPTTNIRYDVPAGGGKVTLRIYDVQGRLVRTLVDENQSPGHKMATWHGRNNHGQSVATGVYFYRMTAPGYVKTRKLVLLK